MHPASPRGACLVAGVKPLLARQEMTLRLVRSGGPRRYARHADSICRTAVYVTRTYGGVGGGDREVFPYPE